MKGKSRFVVVLTIGAGIASASGCGSGTKSNTDASRPDGLVADSIRLASSGSGGDLATIDSALRDLASDVPSANDLAIRDGGSAFDVASAAFDGRDTLGSGQVDIALRDGIHTVDTIVSDAGQARDLTDERAQDGSLDTPTPDASATDAAPSFSWLVPYAEGQKLVSIAQDATSIYWAGWYQKVNGIYRVPKAGGAPSLVVSIDRDIYNPEVLVVDAGFVYFITAPYGSTGPRLFKAPVVASAPDGGSPATLLVEGVGLQSPLIMSAGRLYYSNQGGVGIGSYDTKTGTTSDIVDSKLPSPTDTGCGMAIGHNAGIQSLASDGVDLFYYKWQSYGATVPLGPLSYTGWIVRIPLTGGAQTLLTPGNAQECGTKATASTTSTGSPITNSTEVLRLSNSALYWGASDGSSYYKMSTQGGAATKFLSQPNSGTLTLAIDDPNAYFWCHDAVCRVPLTGGDPVPLLPRQNWGMQGGNNRDDILVDDTSVYVAVAASQALVRMPK